jgi:hypothetical protein
MNIEPMLGRPESGWFRKAPASQVLIDELRSVAPVVIPSDLVDLWLFSNGGESDHLSLPPCNFVLDSVEEVIQSIKDDHCRSEYSGLFFFGGNGGGERLVLDYREPSGPVVAMLDPVAGIESLQMIAATIIELLRAVGPFPEELDDTASRDGYSY